MKRCLIIVILFIMCITNAALSKDVDVLFSRTQTIKDNGGEVTVRVDWLRRPGEMAITLKYYGYLIQEGWVNMYLNVNGINRNFITMRAKNKMGVQRIRIISFHPVEQSNGINKLIKLPDDTIVDYLLFKNAPYYSEFGKLKVEVKFFCNGKWDGNDLHNNDNYVFTFLSPIKGTLPNHF